jgi:hypothetical protein
MCAYLRTDRTGEFDDGARPRLVRLSTPASLTPRFPLSYNRPGLPPAFETPHGG